MAQKKILEIGTEGGGASFLLTRVNGREKVMISTTVNDLETGDITSHNNVFNTLEEAVRRFARRNNGLLRFYPQYVHPAYATMLAVYLNRELRDMPPDEREHLPNKENWERMLNVSISTAPENPDHALVQRFELIPLEKVQTYSYNHFADHKELEHIRTTYEDNPAHKECKKGIGKVAGSAFVIHDEEGKITGIYPLEQYWVKVVEN